MFMKIGLITGCGNGIGYAIAEKLLSTNKEDLIIGISRKNNLRIKELKEKYKNKFIFEECDIEDNQKIKKFLFYIQKNFGPITYAICNAGIRSRFSIQESNLDLYRSVIETNTISNINIAKIIIQNCLENKKKCNILFISSIVGSRGFDELSTYAVSKSALESFMKSAAVELAKSNIQLNCLAPGFVESSFAEEFKLKKKELYDWTISQTPMGRWGKCEEIADLALFLISERNSFMTGSVIYSDGGWTAK